MGSALSTAAAGADRLFPSEMLPKSFEIVMVGLDGAGTTSLLNRLHRRELPLGVLPATVQTIGSGLETIPYGRHSITVWEFGGMYKIRPLWRRYYWNAHAFAFAVDAAASARFADAKEELHRMSDDMGDARPLLVLANKMDLAGALDLGAIAAALDIEGLARRRPERIVALKGVSAMTGEGVDDALQWFVVNVSHELIVQHNAAKKHVVQAW
ncbi:small ARF-related GTPase [Mycena vulgaris]|nr:small ARF-related GTPase [Mycena vulgaris]